jgi:hypothetical protein
VTDVSAGPSALLLMDFRTFVVPAFGGDDRLLRRIAELSEATRARGVDVVHVRISLRTGEAQSSAPSRTHMWADRAPVAALSVIGARPYWHNGFQGGTCPPRTSYP